MYSKKFLLAVVIAYLFLMVTNYAVHEVWLQPIYDQYEDSWRPLGQRVAKMWIMWIGQLLFTLMFAWVYWRGVEAKAWIGQGIRYGATITLLAAVPAVLNEYVIYKVPYRLALTWMSVSLVQIVVMGLVVAYFLRKPPAAATSSAPKPAA